MTHTTDTGAQGNRRLPKDLLGRWQRLNAELETKAEDLHYGGIHVDWSDMAVLNAYLTEDAEFAKWHGPWGNETDDANTIATQAARIAELEETLRFAAQYKGIEGRACPLCKYENGEFIEHCQMHQNMMLAALAMVQQEKELATQAAQLEWKEGLIRQLTDVDMPALEADNERLKALSARPLNGQEQATQNAAYEQALSTERGKNYDLTQDNERLLVELAAANEQLQAIADFQGLMMGEKRGDA